MQFLTFRLADSLPRSVYEEALATIPDKSDRGRHLDAMIDLGRGECLLRAPEDATIVRDALRHFDGERYLLFAWVVMPNHVHVLFEQVEGFRLGEVVRHWKSFTAKQINARRGGSGKIWAKDYFDRYIRDDAHFINTVAYIEANPVKAGLVARPQDWPFSSASSK